MNEGTSPEETQKKRIHEKIAETFAKYEPIQDNPPQIPRIAEEDSSIFRAETSKATAPKTQKPLAEVPASSIVSTGISGLDNMLGGGLPDHSLILIIGEEGSHYKTFVQQILYNHIGDRGKAAYYLAESLSTDVSREMENFNWNLQDHLNKGTWRFINLKTPDLQQIATQAPALFQETSNINLTKGLNNLKTDLLTKTKEERWTALELSHILHHHDLKEVMELLLYWRAATRVYGGIHFALLPTGVHPENFVNALKHLADGNIEFHIREGPHEYDTLMAIKKMRNLLKPLMLPFTVEENGIVIETAARIT